MNSFQRTCSHCGEVDTVPRALAMKCTACGARPGQPCTDLRSTHGPLKPVGYLHPVRKQLIREADTATRTPVTPLRSA